MDSFITNYANIPSDSPVHTQIKGTEEVVELVVDLLQVLRKAVGAD